MTPEGLEKLRSVGHCQFAFASDRNLEDYVYNASDLRDLPGRKYQSKRNHINRFEAEYEYRYEPMTRDHAAECMRLEAEWRKTAADIRASCRPNSGPCSGLSNISKNWK